MKALLLTTAVLLATLPAAAAEPIAFSSDPGPALNIARTLMSAERGEPLRDDELLQVGLVDLDGDGTRDIFAFVDGSSFCGSAGCVPRLYRLERSTGRWAELPIETDAVINGEPRMWTIGDAAPSGWRDLIFTTDIYRITLHWNGAAYVE